MLPLHPTAQLLELLQTHGQRQQQCSVACNRTNVEKDTPATVLGRPLWRTRFRRVFGLEDEPVKSVKMKVETRSGILWRLPHEFALCSLQFRFALRVSVMFHCVEPHPQKDVKPNKRAVSTKSTRIAIILNPPAGPLRRFDLLQTF